MRYFTNHSFCSLAASLAYALIFAPAIGSLLGRRKKTTDAKNDSEDTPLKNNYRKAIGFASRNPLETIAYTFGIMFLILGPSGVVNNYGKDPVYFPSIDLGYNADIQARGNLSPYEAREFALDAEEKCLVLGC